MQLGVVTSILLILVICFLINAWNEKVKAGKFRSWIKEMYGKKPEFKEGYELKNETWKYK